MKTKVFLSIIIPAYNEGNIITTTLNTVKSFLDKKKYSWEVIVVDDGSTDKTAEKVTNFQDGVKLLKLRNNQGKGAALKAGVLGSIGEHVFFTDADLSVPVDNIDTFLGELKNADVVIGSRRVEGATIEIHQPFLRENMGRVYTILSRLITGTNLSDFTCGFKGFREKAAKEIFNKSVIKRWAYDSEILFLANKYRFIIEEVPVSWRNRAESRVALGTDTITSFKDMLMIRIYDWLGKYA